ncbi:MULTISPECIES: HAD family hydrolase [Pedobacter]|uniref:HAD-superfamily hydrolase, subfamily IA, variant 3 n=1 Tax=Pedobacter heparinus (strain ATCC 13125 / DSM 2366 / CIP 104194 / JCM 7457 / NBRC 12017 / NCIMB 9290 / NRRL B-14731 / HIM 762-3) TaxID=485917 RepID=C6XT48_PEDHD|nr:MULTISPECIES: HAD family phosphatase [Pedobacter]ACU03609.1 HAD-superfamily hydrolase, subfamily IA, variant 3 [Pedobacter heparinus DSM 2366]MBB5436879.1 HAD superfamily hydrolase (TIGR01509 family) [Pedobacter sp. AK017]
MEQSRFLKLNQLSAGDYQAFLYDCDGTLADNMPAHTATYLATAHEYGLSIDPAMINELAGWPVADVVVEMNNRYKSNIDPTAFRTRKAELYAAKYIQKIVPIDFVVQHLKANAGKVRIGVVSGGDREAIAQTLEVLGIADLVEVLICAGDTVKGKPFPDPFLKAAELLDVEPSKCMVFEDGVPGVEAAKAAGMDWIRIDLI